MPPPSFETTIATSGTRVHSFGFATICAPSSNTSAVMSGGGGLGGGGLGGGLGLGGKGGASTLSEGSRG